MTSRPAAPAAAATSTSSPPPPSPPPPSRTDPTVARASGILGGAWGRYAGAGRWWTPLRILLALTCVTLLLGFVQKSPCASADWNNNKQYTHMCYSDVVPLWSAERLDVGAVPFRDTSVEYPVLTGGFMLVTADLTRAVHAIDTHWQEVVIFGALTALLLSLCGLVTTAGLVQSAGNRPYDAAIFALSPLLVLHAFTNWDLLAMGLTSGAMWAWARRKPVLAGALIGLGTAAKLYPVFLFVAIGVLAIRTRRYAPAVWSAVAAIGVWAMVNVPIALAYYPGWSEFYRFSIQRPSERSTFWAMIRTLTSGSVRSMDAPFWKPPGAAVAFLLAGALIGVVWVGLRAPAKPRLAQLAFLAVLAFLLTTQVWSPQYARWLVPLVALARPRWRLVLVWQFTEILVWIMTLTLLLGFNQGQQAHGLAYGWLMLVILVRDGILVGIAGLIIRDMWHPELDVVRSGGMDDPGGGFYDGALDYPARDEEPQDVSALRR